MKIIDLSWRLPGPLATFLLAKQGMQVIKYEDAKHRDPFLQWHWDPSFTDIYNAFQNPKELRIVDFGSAADVTDMHNEIRTADAVVMSLPPRVEEKLGLTAEHIAAQFTGVSFTRLEFSRESEHSAHDLNSLAQSDFLKMHILDRTDDIIAPPFLPVTGIFFSHHIAIAVLATVLQQREQQMPIQNWCYLQDAVDNVREAYYPDSILQRNPATALHNGRFPCYNIYRTADGGYLAMAAVEPKFWSKFRELTGLATLGDDDGLAQGERAEEVKQILLQTIITKTTDEWRNVFNGEDACVDLVGPY